MLYELVYGDLKPNQQLPFNQQYIDMMNPQDRDRINQKYIQTFSRYIPDYTRTKAHGDMLLQNYANNIMNWSYPEQNQQLQNYLNQVYGR